MRALTGCLHTGAMNGGMRSAAAAAQCFQAAFNMPPPQAQAPKFSGFSSVPPMSPSFAAGGLDTSGSAGGGEVAGEGSGEGGEGSLSSTNALSDDGAAIPRRKQSWLRHKH